MNIPRFYVDFNEMLEDNLVLLAQDDQEADASGNIIHLYEGLHIHIYSDDTDDEGKPDNLVADGVVEKNASAGWARAAKWCCRISAAGIRHESDCAQGDPT